MVLRVFALLALDRSRAPFATPFAGLLRVVPAFLRAALPSAGFLRIVLALPLTFFFVVLFAIGVSLAPTAFLHTFVHAARAITGVTQPAAKTLLTLSKVTN